MKNPFEIILEKLKNIEKAIKNLRTKATNDNEVLFNRVENYELLKTNFSTL